MSGCLRRTFLALLCVFQFLPLGVAVPASAQQAGEISLAPVELESFPRIRAYVQVRDGEGNFAAGLDGDDIRVLEDGQPLPVAEWELIQPGVQFVLAINPGPSFEIRDAQGISRYEHLALALDSWAQARREAGQDDLSFLGAGGPEATHLAEIGAWRARLQDYRLDERPSTSDFDVLARALEVAADPTPRPGMGRAILFITALPEQDIQVGLESLASRASDRGLKIFIWLIASAGQFDLPAAASLAELASRTGGALFAFSGVEPIVDLETYLEPLRSAYALAYDSRINSSGVHQLAVQVKSPRLELTSPAHEFEVEVLPPSIAFVSPQLEIRRVALQAAEEAATSEPPLHKIDVLVEFPDGHSRSLSRATLYVDGAVADERRSPPFEQFLWDLSGYTGTAQHALRAEVVDSLGLSGATMELSVLVRLEQPPQDVMATLSRNRSRVAILAAILAGAVLVLVLIVGGKVQPGALRGMRRRKKRVSDPVTQPVRMKPEPAPQRLPAWMNRLHWPQRRLAARPLAYLVHLSEGEAKVISPPIAITSPEATFGRDPLQAAHVLEDPSVEALHARLVREADGSFRLIDEGSTAGTWINYTPVSQEGARLEHGDLVHLGRVGFRFTLSEPERVRKPVVRSEEGEA